MNKDIKETREELLAKAHQSADVSADIMILLAKKKVPLDVGLAALAGTIATAGKDNGVDKKVLVKKMVRTIDAVYEYTDDMPTEQ